MSTFGSGKIVEDKPQMRSMQVAPCPVPLVPRRSPVAKQAPLIRPVESASQGWEVKPIAPLPPIYCLERTHLHIDDTAENIAGRISSCLKKESISAVYHDTENLVDAETADGVEFCIRLWEGKNGTVLVEVQKGCGCGYSYAQAARSVLRSAKGVGAPPKRSNYPLPSSIPLRSMEEHEVVTREGLEIAGTLWNKQKLDSQLLAVESLMHLSRSSENPSFTAQGILTGEFQEKLISLVSSSEDHLNEIEKHHMTLMRRYAFTILCNCCATLEQSGGLVSVLQREPSLASMNVMSALVSEISAAAERPHDACQAARCLSSLIAASSDLKVKATQLNAFDSVKAARITGACRHSALEDACTQLRTLL